MTSDTLTSIQVRRTAAALRHRHALMENARSMKRLGIYRYFSLVREAKAASAHVRYLQDEYPDLVAAARAI